MYVLNFVTFHSRSISCWRPSIRRNGRNNLLEPAAFSILDINWILHSYFSPKYQKLLTVSKVLVNVLSSIKRMQNSKSGSTQRSLRSALGSVVGLQLPWKVIKSPEDHIYYVQGDITHLTIPICAYNKSMNAMSGFLVHLNEDIFNNSVIFRTALVIQRPVNRKHLQGCWMQYVIRNSILFGIFDQTTTLTHSLWVHEVQDLISDCFIPKISHQSLLPDI